jgi:hypothetical protein
MSDFDALYCDLKADLQAVSGPLFEFAQQQVQKRGTFLPFGATLRPAGEVSMNAAWTGENMVSSPELLPLLHAGLRADAARGDLSAVAVCEWVKITPAGGSQTDAIKVLVEHARGLTVAFYMPCRKSFLRGWQFGDVMARAAEPEVRPWNAPGVT